MILLFPSLPIYLTWIRGMVVMRIKLLCFFISFPLRNSSVIFIAENNYYSVVKNNKTLPHSIVSKKEKRKKNYTKSCSTKLHALYVLYVCWYKQNIISFVIVDYDKRFIFGLQALKLLFSHSFSESGKIAQTHTHTRKVKRK